MDKISFTNLHIYIYICIYNILLYFIYFGRKRFLSMLCESLTIKYEVSCPRGSFQTRCSEQGKGNRSSRSRIIVEANPSRSKATELQPSKTEVVKDKQEKGKSSRR